MTNLVIVMAGDRSLHEEYARDRDFELWVCYYGDDEATAARYRGACDRFFQLKGQKWGLVRELAARLGRGGATPFSKFDYVFLPDDDIRFPGGAEDVSKVFGLAREVGADIFQPAVSNENYSLSWEATQINETCVCRAVPFVEGMMPGFSSRIFECSVLPLLHVLGHVQAGWGMEPLYVRLGEALLRHPVRVFVLDAAAAVHTRQVGKGDAATDRGRFELALMPQYYANPFRELARFASVAEARDFKFPFLDDSADNVERDRRIGRTMAKIRFYNHFRGSTLKKALQWLLRRTG